jgi:putative integral membrane protein (TIGR02587 family)
MESSQAADRPAQGGRQGESRSNPSDDKRVAIGYARGVMGGLLVGIPSMLTMEMWWEGFFVPAWRLLLLFVINGGVLFILQHYSGLTHRKTFAGQLRATVTASGIGVVTAALVLLALGVFHGDVTWRNLAGKLLLQSIPVSIGASVAMSEFGEEHRVAEERREQAGFWGNLGMALGGSMLFGFAISGTEEPLMIADQLSWPAALLLLFLSLAQVYAIVFAVDFKQQPDVAGTPKHLFAVAREVVATYALALVAGAYLLWTFETIGPRIGLVTTVYSVITIGLVTSLGAAAAELLI